MALPRPLSHSSISLYGECPQKYKFKYIDKIPEKPKHFFSFGSSVHQALEFFYGVQAPPPPALEEVLADYEERWISAGYKDEAQEAQYLAQGRAILAAFYRKHAADFAVPFFVEYKFDLSVDGVPVTGRVDRVDKLADGRLAILDYKTGKALAAGRAQTDSQLTMYQMGCEQLLGAEVARLSFYHLPSLTEHAVERRPGDQVEGLRRRIVSTADAIVRGLFEPQPEEQKCRWCDYKPLCPVFRHQYAAGPISLEAAPAAARGLREAADLAASGNGNEGVAGLGRAGAPGLGPVEGIALDGLEDEISALVDQYGELRGRLAELQEEVERVKAALWEALQRKGYFRAFGRRYEVSRSLGQKWEFTDKKKVLALLREAGLYEGILAPSAPKIEQLMNDPRLDRDLRARLEGAGERIERPEIKVKPLREPGGEGGA